VTLSNTDANAKIYYTIDGSAPSASSTLYAGALQVATSETINAIAIDPALQNSNIATAAYIIQPPVTDPTFAMSGSPMATIKAGTSSTSTITITPSGGFTGTITFGCTIAGGPAGATMPTCSIDPSASISGTQPAKATLTIKTTAATSGMTNDPVKHMFAVGSETLVALLILLPIRRRRWQSLAGMVLLVFLVSAACGCGGGNTPVKTSNSGTTPGNYVATVTGTMGTTKVSTTVPFAVQ
jgi:hypothetical protein